MAKYQRKPVFVEAIQLEEDPSNIDEVRKFIIQDNRVPEGKIQKRGCLPKTLFISSFEPSTGNFICSPLP